MAMDRAYSYCMAYTKVGYARCNNRCEVSERYCVSCKALRAAPKINSGTPVKQDGEKGTAYPSNLDGVVAQEQPRKRYEHEPKVPWYDILGGNTAEKLIRAAHGLKCTNCGEVIAELSDNITNYGWVHCPDGESYTYCYPERNQIDLKAEPVLADVEID